MYIRLTVFCLETHLGRGQNCSMAKYRCIYMYIGNHFYDDNQNIGCKTDKIKYCRVENLTKVVYQIGLSVPADVCYPLLVIEVSAT